MAFEEIGNQPFRDIGIETQIIQCNTHVISHLGIGGFLWNKNISVSDNMKCFIDDYKILKYISGDDNIDLLLYAENRERKCNNM